MSVNPKIESPAGGHLGLVQSVGASGHAHSPAGPPDVYRPLWAITNDSDGQDPSFASDFVSHAFPPAMVSRLDGMGEKEFKEQYYTSITQMMAYSASSIRRSKKALREAAEQVSQAEASERKYKKAFNQMLQRVSALELERNSLLQQVEDYKQRDTQHRTDMEWMLQHGIPDSFDQSFMSDLFVHNSKRLYKAIGDAGVERGCREMRAKFGLQVPDNELPFYQPGRGDDVQQALSEYGDADYVSSSGLDRSSFDSFKASCLGPSGRREETDSC